MIRAGHGHSTRWTSGVLVAGTDGGRVETGKINIADDDSQAAGSEDGRAAMAFTARRHSTQL